MLTIAAAGGAGKDRTARPHPVRRINQLIEPAGSTNLKPREELKWNKKRKQENGEQTRYGDTLVETLKNSLKGQRKEDDRYLDI